MIEGIRVPVIIDTGAEVSVLPITFLQNVCPGQSLPAETKDVRSLGGALIKIRGPMTFEVEVCDVILQHPFYFYDNPTFLMGYDLISAAALIIDSNSKCVWSKHTSDRNISSPLVPSRADTEYEASSANCSSHAEMSAGASTLLHSHTSTDSCGMETVFDSPCFTPHSSSLTYGPRAVPYSRSFQHGCNRDCIPATIPPDHLSLSPTLLTHSTSLEDALPTEASRDISRSPSHLSHVDKPSDTDIVLQKSQHIPHAILTAPPGRPPDLDMNFENMSNQTSAADTKVKEVIDDSKLPEHVNLLFLQTIEETNLPSDVVRDLKILLSDHRETFAESSTDLGFCPILKHDIDTGDSRPVKQSPRRPPLAAREAEDQILNEMLEGGIIEPSNSPWASPVCLVRKKDGSFRFCIDYRRVNAVSRKDAYPLPDILDALDHLRGAKYFATIDLLSGYWQLGMTERAKERSAFCTRRGLFQFTRMPFGLSGAPSSFCRLMSIVLRDLLWVICLCYLDDIVIYARTPQELLERLRMVLDRLKHVGLKVKPSKCDLFKTEIKFLGHQVSVHGIEPLPDKLETIRDWPTPRCVRDVRAFFGLASYYRRFVKGFATIAEPLTRLTRKQARFEWSDEAQEAFDSLKRALVDATSLAFPYPDRPCILDTDASDVALGAVLSQSVDGIEKPIAFFSRVMNSAQRNYCATRRELLAVISALQHFRHYLLGNKVILRTDHYSLKWLNTFKRPEGILARWVETLAEFDIQIEHRPGRLHSNVDGVSRPFCKQCTAKTVKTNWVDELERADEITEPLGVNMALYANQNSPTDVNVVTIVPELSNADVAEFQAEDSDLGPIVEWLLNNEQPPPELVRSMSLETRNLWSQVPAIQIQNDVLVRKMSDHQSTQLVVPECLRKRLFDTTHAGPLSAHLGSQRTLLQLRQAYYWPGMRKDVVKWYQQCDICAQSKGPPTKHKGRLQKVFTGAPLDIVAVDILSGVPVTPEGHKYILVLTDYFTKWVCAFALPDAEASTCMRAMYDGFFAQFGLPRQIHSDLGKNFESKLFHELCALTGVRKSHTTPFHPQSDGQTERMNRTLLQMLRTTADENPHSWPQRLHTVLSAYRMTVHQVTGVTPNMAMLGREVLLPATLIASPPEETTTVTVPFVVDLRDTLRSAHRKVRAATKSVAKTQKRYYDQRSKTVDFAVGQSVWLYWPKPPVRQKFKKLQRLWTGPWIIIRFKTPLVVEIQHFQKKNKQTVHVDRLAPCCSLSSATPETPSQQDEGVTDSTPALAEEDGQLDSQSTSQMGTQETQSFRDSLSSRPHRIKRKPKALEPYILG